MKKLNAILILMILLNCFSANAQTNLLTEGFEAAFPPTGWIILNQGDTTGETWMQSDGYHHSGTKSAFSQDGEQNEGMEEWLITPAISVPSNSYIEISFWHKFQWGSSGVDPEYVLVSTTTPTADAFTDTVYTIPFPGSAEWQQININDLPNYAGKTIYIAFLHYTGSGNGYGDAWVIDDISVDYYETGETDLGMLSVLSPENNTMINTEITPKGIIKNFGTTNITDAFKIICSITNSESVVVYNDTINYTTGINSELTDTVTFENTWTPSIIGDYTVNMNTVLDGDQNTSNDSLSVQFEIIKHYGTGGPDNFGYKWIDSDEPDGPVYNWIEISGTGESSIQYGFPYPYYYGDDNLSAPIPIGFSFPFYGINRDSMYIDTNGEILLADNNWYNEYPGVYQNWGIDGNMFNYIMPIPGNTSMPALVSVFWDDLEADEGIGDVYFQTFGTAPDRYCVVQWNNMRFHSGTVEDTTLTFEAIFHENGDMIFQYKNVNIGQTGSVCPHDNGQSATIGIQNDTYDIGLCYLFEVVEDGAYIGVDPVGNILHNEFAIKFYTGVDDQPPYYTYEGKGNTFDNTPEFKINISDNSNILSDSLYYNTGDGWNAVGRSSFTEPNTYYYELPEISNNSTVNYYFVATDNSTNNNRGVYPSSAPDTCLSFKILPTTNVKVLLAYAGNQDGDSLEFNKYITVLDSANIKYDVYDWQEYDDYKFTSNYEAIFAYANSAGPSYKHDTLSIAFMDYLDMGTTEKPKNLFFASDDFSYSQNGYPNSKPMVKFENAYIRSWHIPPGSNGLVYNGYDYVDGSVIGVAGTPIGTEGVEMPVYANSPDVINNGACPSWYEDEVVNPTRSSSPAFIFEDGPTGHAGAYHYSCSSWLDNLIYKSFFMTFDLSQFNDDDIYTIITDALNWFNIVSINLGDDISACEGDTVTLDAGNGYDSYLWSTGSTSQTIDVIQTNNYSVTVTDNGNQAVDSINVTFNPNPVVDLGQDTIVTADSLLLDAGAGFDSYLWSTGATTQTIYIKSTGTYYVNVIDINGCSGSDTLTVTFNTDINDLVNNCNIFIYPNPNNGKFSVVINSNKTQSVVLELYDINARVIYKKHIYGLTTFNQSLDISELSKGIYYLRVKTNDNVEVKKVVIY